MIFLAFLINYSNLSQLDENNISSILSKLMDINNLDERKLSKLTGVAHSSISRIKLNPQSNITTATLIPLAKYFNITIGQLIGEEPLWFTHTSHIQKNETLPKMLPLLKISDIEQWLTSSKKDIYDEKYFVSTLLDVSEKAFCVQVDSNLKSIAVRHGSKIIVDPNKDIKPTNLVLARMNSNIKIFRVTLNENNLIYKELDIGSKELINPNKNFLSVIGVITEVVYNINE